MITNIPSLGTWARRAAGALVVAVGLAGCDAIDPTEVNNPTTTDEDLAKATNPTAALVPGLRAQFARLTSSWVVDTEVVSDNYSIHGTGIVVDMDEPAAVTPGIMNGTGTGSGSSYWNAQELRALADFVIDEIAPNDPTAPADLVAEAHFYRGMAYLILGETYSYAPHEEDGVPQPSDVAFQRAVTDFQAAAAFGPQAQAALARTYRMQGDASSAQAAATAALAADPSLLFSVDYDATSITNSPVAFLVLRALQEMQPLPRLDFLDPKYTDRESAIPIAKAEEMHLILAEIELAAGNIPAGRDHLADAINLAGTRGTVTFDDIDERRNADLSLRPRSSEILIRADASSPLRAGLVLNRPSDGLVIPSVSATSLDADSVAALTDAAEVWHALWLARQEIMLLEGRRLGDLGIKLPMMRREIDQNDGINAGDPGTVAVVPSWIPAGFAAMDVYTPGILYDGVDPGSPLIETEVTINVDMNRVLTENNVSPFN